MKPFAFVLFYGIAGITSTVYFIPPKELLLSTTPFEPKARIKLRLLK